MAEEIRKLNDDELDLVAGGVMPKYDYRRLMSEEKQERLGSSGFAAWLTEHMFRTGLQERTRNRK